MNETVKILLFSWEKAVDQVRTAALKSPYNLFKAKTYKKYSFFLCKYFDFAVTRKYYFIPKYWKVKYVSDLLLAASPNSVIPAC